MTYAYQSGPRGETGRSGANARVAGVAGKSAAPAIELDVGDGIVNALRERPCMLHRFPKGLAGDNRPLHTWTP